MEEALGNHSCYKSENSLSLHGHSLGDVSPPKIVSVPKDEKKRSPINLAFKSR